MQTQNFYNDLTQPHLHPLSSNFNPKLEAPLIQGFQIKHSSNTIELWIQLILLTLGFNHPLQSSRDTSLLNNTLSDTPHLRILK